MEVDEVAFVRAYPICQRFKKQKKKDRTVHPKTIAMIKWETLHLDLVGPSTTMDKSCTDRVITTIIFIGPETAWFMIIEIPCKSSAMITQIFNDTRLA